MKAFRVKITTWTSSFRYPNLMSAFQPTLEVPPISTILGLLNAAAGGYVCKKEIQLGYYFEYDAKAIDLESIYQISVHTTKNEHYPRNSVISNIIQREFLYNCRLFLYFKEEEYASFFKNPMYQLLLGRSGDLAGVENIKEIEMQEVQNAKISGQVIPFNGNYLPGQIQALPKYFTNTIPRKNIGTEPYSVISFMHPVDSQLIGYKPGIIEFDGDIYFHKLEI